ncbi:proline-specific peptidase [Agrocybe pediades]|nr:proline-specific peptidase [Agrocybe pediades]
MTTSEEFTTGTVDFKVGSETYQTWYKVYGDLKNSQRRPLVTLHGGPGMSHHYMLPHKAVYEKEGIPVVFYDQLGNGESSHRRDAPKEFWTPELFMDELDNLLKALRVQDDFDLIGQSWGGMLAAHYAAARTPKGLKRLIIANSPASIELYGKGTASLLAKLPEEIRDNIRKHEEAGTYSSVEYQQGVEVFMKKHVCRVDPWPQDLVDSFKAYEEDKTVYSTMLGPSEFSINGTLKDWNIIDIVHKIHCPTLLISAPDDEVQEEAALPFFKNIPKIKWVELQNSTHLAMFEEPERYFKVLLDFVRPDSA